jgi:hypothetical protein
LVQLSFEDLIAEEKLEAPALCLFGSPARGLAARVAEFDQWVAEHGNFGSVPRSHGWHAHSYDGTGDPSGRCQPAVMSADLRCDHMGFRDGPCCCVGNLLERGACRGCDWEGEPRLTENAAAEDACDHAWPGWRDLPTVPKPPAWNGGTTQKERGVMDRWVARVNSVYPPGWLEAGGPVRTLREPVGTRHVPGGTMFGGYDMAVPAP